MHGGTVHTIDASMSSAQAVAIRDGRIAAVGSVRSVTEKVGPGARVIDLEGRCVVPGFIDAHNHFGVTVFSPVSVDCKIPPGDSRDAVLAKIEAAAANAVPGQWIRGFGFTARMGNSAAPNAAEPLTRWELDEVAPGNPVYVMASSYHACFANSVALKLGGVTTETPDPPMGTIVRDADGEPSGVLWENAIDPVHGFALQTQLDDLGPDAVADLVLQNAKRHFEYGVTTVADAAVIPQTAQALESADQQGKLPIAVVQLRTGDTFVGHPQRAIDGAFLKTDNISDRLRGGGAKIFMDPVYPAMAHFKRRGDGSIKNIGSCNYSQDEANRLLATAAENDVSVAIHCLGSRSIDRALGAIAYAVRYVPNTRARPRLEHFSMATRSQLLRGAALGVTLSYQPAFLYTHGELNRDARIATGIDADQIPMRTLIDAGARLAAGSDDPCAPLDPLVGLYAMVTRRTRSGGGPIAESERITVAEGLTMYTHGSAYALFREHEVGSIETGKRADIVVLNRDPEQVPPQDILDIRVEATYVDGHLVYERSPTDERN